MGTKNGALFGYEIRIIIWVLYNYIQDKKMLLGYIQNKEINIIMGTRFKKNLFGYEIRIIIWGRR